MTAIAFKDGVVACDSLGMFGAYKLSRDVKKVRVLPGLQAIAGGTGATREIDAFIDWLCEPKGDAPDIATDEDGESDAIINVFHADGRIDVHSSSGVSHERLEFQGMGCFDFLIGAMAAGADAVTAVAAACEYVRGCDWPVKVYRFGKAEPEIITRDQWLASRAVIR